MYFRWLPFALFVCVFTTVTAQQEIESLTKSFRSALEKGDHASAGIFESNIAKSFTADDAYDSALSRYRHALVLNKRAANDSMVAFNYNDIGAIFKNLSYLDSASYYYLKASERFQAIGDTARYGAVSINLAMVYNERGLWDKALQVAFAAVDQLEKRKFDRTLGTYYLTIGTSHKGNRDLDKALKAYYHALSIYRKENYPKGVGNALNNLGNVYVLQGKYDSALINLRKAIAIKKSLNSKGIGSTLNNIGDVFFKQGRTDSAKVYYTEALQAKREVGDKSGEAITLNGLALCAIKEGILSLALEYLMQAESIEQSVGGLLEQRVETLQLMVQLFRVKNDYRRALELTEALFVIKDSLYNKEKAAKIEEVQASYEDEKKQQQIEVLNIRNNMQELAIDNRELWIAILAIAVLVILISLLFYFLSYVNAKRHRESVELLMKELHHRVKNNLQVLSSVLSLQSQALTDENALLSVKSTESRINAMALIHRKLYSDDRNTIVSTRGYFRELIEFLMSSYGYHENNLTLETDIDEIELDVDKAIPLGLIMNELISNAFKHAYINKANAQLVIQVKKRDNVLTASIRDNGSGETAPQGDETKFGMRMVNILVRDLKGDFNTSINHGTEHRITFPFA